MDNNRDFEDIPEFDRALRGLVGVNPHELGNMQLKRTLRRTVRSTDEQVVVQDWREVIGTTTNFNKEFRSSTLGDAPHLRTDDGREVRCKNYKYLDKNDREILADGVLEILIDGQWEPLDVSP